MTNTKMNMVAKFNAIVDALEGRESALTTAEMVEFINSRIDLLNKKASNKKATATQEANEVLKSIILNTLTSEPVTVSELMKKSDDLSELSNQKVSALLRALVLDEKVVKTVDKKKSFFALA